MKLLAEVGHEFGTWGDGIAIKELRHLLAAGFDLSLEKSAFTCTSESSSPLLVHLSSWCDAIDRQKDVLLRFDEMDYFVYGLHDRRPQLFHVLKSRNSFVPLRVISMHTVVHNTVEVQV